MFFQHALPIVLEAEEHAADGAPLSTVLKVLRRLPLEDFGELLLSMPNDEYPGLSGLLPAMASGEVQKKWTGSSGLTLLGQSTAFVRQAAYLYASARGEGLEGKTILDFGCGYGRLLRLMLYFTDPDRLWGLDAWERSLEASREAGVLAHLRKSDTFPQALPVDGTRFDFAYAFSVFTHLSPRAAEACLGAVRSAMAPGGIFVATIRPIEFWRYLDEARGTSVAADLTSEHHRHGFAYLPHAGPEGDAYGDASVAVDFFDRPAWQLLGHDRSRGDRYQLSVVLRAV